MTRRTVFRRAFVFTSALAGNLFAASHFWDQSPAARWTPDQIAELVAKSPWAKPAMAQYRTALELPGPGPGREPVQGRGEATVGPCGLVPCSDIQPGQVTVLWESAQPIREALHPAIPGNFNGQYVISIRGLLGEQSLDRLEAGADLAIKGQPPLQTAVVAQRNASYLFGFSRELLPITTADKGVQFTLYTGAELKDVLVRATFIPREMIYRGKLAL